jgi:hypothetical protein
MAPVLPNSQSDGDHFSHSCVLRNVGVRRPLVARNSSSCARIWHLGIAEKVSAAASFAPSDIVSRANCSRNMVRHDDLCALRKRGRSSTSTLRPMRDGMVTILGLRNSWTPGCRAADGSRALDRRSKSTRTRHDRYDILHKLTRTQGSRCERADLLRQYGCRSFIIATLRLPRYSIVVHTRLFDVCI